MFSRIMLGCFLMMVVCVYSDAKGFFEKIELSKLSKKIQFEGSSKATKTKDK